MSWRDDVAEYHRRWLESGGDRLSADDFMDSVRKIIRGEPVVRPEPPPLLVSHETFREIVAECVALQFPAYTGPRDVQEIRYAGVTIRPWTVRTPRGA